MSTKAPKQRDDVVRFRITSEERELFSAAARKSGESLSAWFRRAGRERLQNERKATR